MSEKNEKQAEREGFEAWLSEDTVYSTARQLGGYISAHADIAWKAWQGRAALAAPSASAQQARRCTIGAKCEPHSCTCRSDDSQAQCNAAAPAPSASPAALTDAERDSARYLNMIAQPGFLHYPELKAINAYLQRVLLAASPADQVGWQPIETAPMDGTPVLLYARSENARAPVRVVGWWIYGQRWVECAFAPNHPTGLVPTHWMPLPTAPSMSATPPAAEE